MSRSSIAMGVSWVLCKSTVLNSNPTTWMRRATVGRPLQKNVWTVPDYTREPSSGSMVSLMAAMSILYLAISPAMRRCDVELPAQCSVDYVHPNLPPRVAVILLKNLSSTFFDRMWDNPVAAVGHPGRLEQAMFGPPSLGPSSNEGEQCGC